MLFWLGNECRKHVWRKYFSFCLIFFLLLSYEESKLVTPRGKVQKWINVWSDVANWLFFFFFLMAVSSQAWTWWWQSAWAYWAQWVNSGMCVRMGVHTPRHTCSLQNSSLFNISFLEFLERLVPGGRQGWRIEKLLKSSKLRALIRFWHSCHSCHHLVLSSRFFPSQVSLFVKVYWLLGSNEVNTNKEVYATRKHE